jgi:DeoR/GlpR family transcriptional regulator of sugar metabolism
VLQEERHHYILGRIKAEKRLQVDALSKALEVSVDTIRRDLIELEKMGQLMRVHGGAIANDFHTPFQPVQVHAQKEKRKAARKALTLLQDGMTLFAGGGTVIVEWARMLPENLTGTLFTISPLVALEAAQRSSIEVVLLSGKVSRSNYICMGPSVLNQIKDIRADLCFMSTNGFSTREGITDVDWEVMQIKKALMQASSKTAILSIAEKNGIAHPYRVCAIHEIDYLITEAPADDLAMTEYNGYCRVL